MPKIRIFNIANNHINHVSESALTNMLNLEKIYMQGNNIMSFPFQFILKISPLSLVQLEGNNLEAIPDLRKFTNCPTTVQLVFKENPLKCDIGLCWLKEYVQTNLVIELSDQPCASPPESVPLYWTNISWSSIGCHKRKFEESLENIHRISTSSTSYYFFNNVQV